MPAERGFEDPLAGPAPRVYTIAPGRPFLEDLAAMLLARAGDDPLSLARLTVLLPTRRAGRALAEAMLRLSGGRPTVLPRIHPIGDLPDEALALAGALDGPPPIGGLARVALLARLVAATDRSLPVDRTWRLAGELAALMDELATDEIDPRRIAGLVPDEFAAHWQKTLRFLDILVEAWPRILAERGLSDPAERRIRLIRAQIAAWTDAPPAGPVIAAGSTGSIPAIADLLGLVARLPRGAVVLPGLDLAMEEAAWEDLPDTHPQAGLARLLERIAVGRDEVRPWPVRADAEEPPDRAALAAALFATPQGLG
ncbi:MAG: double-strand break repair protein AddB, partial [Acetobacteraceae bacterium]